MTPPDEPPKDQLRAFFTLVLVAAVLVILAVAGLITAHDILSGDNLIARPGHVGPCDDVAAVERDCA